MLLLAVSFFITHNNGNTTKIESETPFHLLLQFKLEEATKSGVTKDVIVAVVVPGFRFGPICALDLLEARLPSLSAIFILHDQS